jgi:hypothetical protein
MVLMLLHGTAQLIDLAFPQLLFPSLVFFFLFSIFFILYVTVFGGELSTSLG